MNPTSISSFEVQSLTLPMAHPEAADAHADAPPVWVAPLAMAMLMVVLIPAFMF